MPDRFPHLPGEEWPDLPPVPPSMPDLGEHPTRLELEQAMGSTLLMFGQLWPRVVHALEFLRRAVYRLERRRHEGGQHPALPPMRERQGSSHDLAQAVGLEVAERIEAEQRNPSTPAPDLKATAAIVADPVQVAIQRIKAENWDRLEAERKLAETERLAVLAAADAATARLEEMRRQLEFVNAKERIKFRWASRLAVLAAVLGAAAWAIEHFSHGQR